MALEQIQLGSPPTGTGGDTVRAAFEKCNGNFGKIQQHTVLTDARFQQMAALIRSLHPELPALRLDFEGRSFAVNGMPVSPEELFVPGFRPADKLVWNGSAFEVAPAGQLAYMRHPQTGRRMMVVEPSATNLVASSCEYGVGTGWGSVDIAVDVVPGIITDPALGTLIPGQRLTNTHESNISRSINRIVGTVPAGAQTATWIIGRGTSSHVMLGVRDDTVPLWLVALNYFWDSDVVTLWDAAGGENVSFGRIKLNSDTVLVWATVTAVAGSVGNVRRLYVYPSYARSGENSVVYHMQLENSAYWTSPIVTGSTAVTRASDVLRIDEYDQIVGANPVGTVYAEAEHPMQIAMSNSYYLMESDGGQTPNSIIYHVGTTSNSQTASYSTTRRVENTAAQAAMVYPSAPSVRVASSVAEQTLVSACNGSSSVRGGVEGGLPAVNRLVIAGATGVVTRPLWISKITRDNRVRTAAELEAMTS